MLCYLCFWGSSQTLRATSQRIHIFILWRSLFAFFMIIVIFYFFHTYNLHCVDASRMYLCNWVFVCVAKFFLHLFLLLSLCQIRWKNSKQLKISCSSKMEMSPAIAQHRYSSSVVKMVKHHLLRFSHVYWFFVCSSVSMPAERINTNSAEKKCTDFSTTAKDSQKSRRNSSFIQRRQFHFAFNKTK